MRGPNGTAISSRLTLGPPFNPRPPIRRNRALAAKATRIESRGPARQSKKKPALKAGIP
jgi:hypothetical protein